MYYIYGAKWTSTGSIHVYHIKYEGVAETLEIEHGMVKVDGYDNVWCFPGTSARSIAAGRPHYEIVKIPVLEELASE